MSWGKFHHSTQCASSQQFGIFLPNQFLMTEDQGVISFLEMLSSNRYWTKLPSVKALTVTFVKATSPYVITMSNIIGFWFLNQVLALYSAAYTLCVFTLGSVMFVIPQPAYFLMGTMMVLSDELSQQSLTPLVISTFICLVSEYKLYFQNFLCDVFFLLFWVKSHINM